MSPYESPPEELEWRVARTCEGGACVAVARNGDAILIRRSTDPGTPVIRYTADEWREFLAGVKLGDFDGIA
jgi:predicted secreted Zn-dependent protease